MEMTKTTLDGLLLVKPRLFKDERGWFVESYNRETFKKAAQNIGAEIDIEFVQDNHSHSTQYTLRGLHFQTSPGQAKLIRCTLGCIWDVAVDIRPNSPTLGKYFGIELSEENPTQIFIPVGFAHGFMVLSDRAEVQYKCSNVYNAATESGIQWDDADLQVPWPLNDQAPVISNRDTKNQSFKQYCEKIKT